MAALTMPTAIDAYEHEGNMQFVITMPFLRQIKQSHPDAPFGAP